MTEEVEQLLKNLKLRRMLSVYDEQLHAAEKAGVSYSEFVAGLLRAQWHDRQESALEWRIGRANLPERWSLETFPYARQPGVNRKQIRAFAELDFVAKHENLVLVGPTGVRRICFDEMYASLADWSTRRFVPSGRAVDRWVRLLESQARLSKPPSSDRFVLKGALLPTAWRAPLSRPTI